MNKLTEYLRDQHGEREAAEKLRRAQLALLLKEMPFKEICKIFSASLKDRQDVRGAEFLALQRQINDAAWAALDYDWEDPDNAQNP